jgi:hypothetical protein
MLRSRLKRSGAPLARSIQNAKPRRFTYSHTCMPKSSIQYNTAAALIRLRSDVGARNSLTDTLALQLCVSIG